MHFILTVEASLAAASSHDNHDPSKRPPLTYKVFHTVSTKLEACGWMSTSMYIASQADKRADFIAC
jgi:hypothetical protein